MKKLLCVIMLAMLSAACHKKEDAPPPTVPSVAGVWEGSGTDDTIGYYTFTATLEQDGDTAFGTYHTVSDYATTSGKIRIDMVKSRGGNNVAAVELERTTWSANSCAGTMSLHVPTFITASSIGFYYTGSDCKQTGYNGGANLKKTIAAN